MNDTNAADVIAAARMRVHSRHPYLSATLFALRPCPAPGLGTLAVDDGWRLYYDPETVLRWHQEEVQAKLDRIGGQGKGHDGVAAVVFHELGHVLRQHHKRRGDRDAFAWNLAGDAEINDDLEEAGWTLPGVPVTPSAFGKPNGLTAEEYYKIKEVMIVGPCHVPGSGGKCGGCAGNPTDWEKENTGNKSMGSSHVLAPGAGTGIPAPLDPVGQEVALRRTALAVAEHVKAKGQGFVPAGLRAWADAKLTPPRIDWRRKLAALVRGSLAAVAGASDFTWRKTGRRSLHAAGKAGWPIAPALHQPCPKVAVVLDTSGSMGGEPIREALSEVLGIARAAGAGVKVFACDAAVHAAALVAKESDLEKVNKGAGGTDMRPGFTAARKEKADLVAIVTDGLVGGGWPDALECRGVRTLAVLVGQSGEKPPSHIPWVEVN